MLLLVHIHGHAAVLPAPGKPGAHRTPSLLAGVAISGLVGYLEGVRAVLVHAVLDAEHDPLPADAIGVRAVVPVGDAVRGIRSREHSRAARSSPRSVAR
jgi:hypothetical protein